MNIRAQKRSLRRTMVERILSLSTSARREQESVLIDRFASLPGYDVAVTVLLYVTAFPEEIATRPMLEQALAAGKRVLCPRVDRAACKLELHQVEDLGNDLVPGVLGIPEPRPGTRLAEPSQVDWVLVPGLLFDEGCYRVGRGAGHYDRLLPQLRPDAPRWALAFDCQWVDRLPVEPHDVALDGVVSPSKCVTRNHSAETSTLAGLP